MEIILSLETHWDVNVLNLSGLTEPFLSEIAMASRRSNTFGWALELCMVVFGVPSSIVCTYIMYSNSNKVSSAILLLIANSVSSTLFLCLAVPKYTLKAFGLFTLSSSSCAAYCWLLAMLYHVSNWTLVILIVIRFLAVVSPHLLFNRIMGSRSLIVFSLIILLTSLYHIRFFLLYEYRECDIKLPKNDPFPWLFLVLDFILPITIIMFFSVWMMVAIQLRNNMTLSRTLVKQSYLFMRITVTSCGCIFLSTLPSILHFGLANNSEMWVIEEPWLWVRHHFVEMVVVNVFLMRHALDVIIYMACSRRFRGELFQLLHIDKCLLNVMPYSVNVLSSSAIGMYSEGVSSGDKGLTLKSALSRSMVIAMRDSSDRKLSIMKNYPPSSKERIAV